MIQYEGVCNSCRNFVTRAINVMIGQKERDKNGETNADFADLRADLDEALLQTCTAMV